MVTKVIASTSGIVSATTMPGQMSIRSGLVCSPKATKLTASTTAIASISTRTNSPTERDTAVGWSCTCSSVMPAGRLARIASTLALSALPMTMMSPPLAMDTPRAITALPWWRTLTDGGSTTPRLISAMSPNCRVLD